MDLSVPFAVVSDPSKAYELAKVEITPEYIAKFKVKAEISYDEDARIISAKGKGFKLILEFKDSATQVSLELSFLLKAFRKNILEKVKAKLTKHI